MLRFLQGSFDQEDPQDFVLQDFVKKFLLSEADQLIFA